MRRAFLRTHRALSVQLELVMRQHIALPECCQNYLQERYGLYVVCARILQQPRSSWVPGFLVQWVVCDSNYNFRQLVR